MTSDCDVNMKARRWRLLLAVAAVYSGGAFAGTDTAGNVLAKQLNQDYKNTATGCAGGMGAVWCSGVLIRPGMPETGSWQQTAAEKKMHSLAANFIRSEMNTAGFTWGAILSQPTPEKGPQPACAYPQAVPSDRPRNNAGCGNPANDPHIAPVTDLSSCDGAGIFTAADYIRHNATCSFSTQINTEFSAALTVNAAGTAPLQVWMMPWNTDKPSAVRGFVYQVGDPTALQQARREKGEYQSLTGKELPVVAFDSTAGLFSYDSQNDKPVKNQNDSMELAAVLNARYQAEGGMTISFVLPAMVASDVVADPTDDAQYYNTFQFDGTADNIPAAFQAVSETSATYGVIRSVAGNAIFYNNGTGSQDRVSVRTMAYRLQQKMRLQGAPLQVVRLAMVNYGMFISQLEAKSPLFFGEKQQTLPENDSAQTAQKLNQRMANLVDDCGNGRPAWECSGVIIRTTDARYPMTSNPANPVTSFSYIRHDTRTSNLWNTPQGVILTPTATLMDRLGCIYPMDASTWNVPRDPDNLYCTMASQNLTRKSPDDLSSCSSVLSGHTAQALSQQFDAKYPANDIIYQCSFSVRDPVEFLAAILSSASHAPNDVYKWNELIARHFSSPQDFPQVEAFWYQTGSAAGRAAARNYVHYYHQNVDPNVDIPVVSYDYATQTFGADN